jgi:tRNA(Ile)-lysidine synthase
MPATAWQQFLDQLAVWLERRGLLEPQAGWVVGVSGGPDSTLLLHALHTLSQKRQLNWRLHVAHLNHRLRGAESDEDERFVVRLAERLGLSAHVERQDVRQICARSGGSLEEVARQQRYLMLERAALLTDSRCVAVAHHADDNAETIFHRICRGTGLRGLAGISEVRPIRPGSRILLVRPLLEVRRATIKELCAACGLDTRTDSSNLAEGFTRNRIRNLILPLLREQLNPNVSEALLRLAAQARQIGDYVTGTAQQALESVLAAEPDRQITLSIPALRTRHRAIQAEIIRQALTRLTGRRPGLDYVHVEAILRLIDQPPGARQVHLPGQMIARREQNRLVIQPAQDGAQPPDFSPVAVRCSGRTPLPQLGGELVAELHPFEPGQIERVRASARPEEAWLDYDKLQLPLLVRSRRRADRFHPLGAPGTKSVSDFLTDSKTDAQLRARVALLCDQAGVVWVIPLRIDDRAKLTAHTRRALHLVLHAGRNNLP